MTTFLSALHHFAALIGYIVLVLFIIAAFSKDKGE